MSNHGAADSSTVGARAPTAPDVVDDRFLTRPRDQRGGPGCQAPAQTR